MSNFNYPIVGLMGAIRDEQYQQMLDAKVGGILGNEESISLATLKNNSIFAKAYNELNEKGKTRFDQIANMEGDAQNVSEKELKVILTALDANLQNVNGRQKFVMDGNASTGETGGLNEATDGELQVILQNMKTRAENFLEAKRKQEARNEKIKNTTEQAKDIKPYDDNGRVNGGEWAKAVQIIDSNISAGSEEGLEDWTTAFKQILDKGQIVHSETYGDGGSTKWFLEDCTTVYLNNGFGDRENGFITVTHPDGTVEKFKPDGTKVE